MKKFLLKMVLSLIFLILFSIRFVDTTIGENLYEHPLESAWKATGLKLNDVSTETWLKVNDRWMTVYELKQLSRDIQKKLNIKANTADTFGEEKDFTYLSFEGIRPDHTVVTVTLQSSKDWNNRETQLGLYTVSNGKTHDLRRYIGELADSISVLGDNVNLSVLLEGEYHGKLSPVLVKDLTGKAFRKVNAEWVESNIQAEGSMSKGYTTLIKEANYTGKHPVNLVISTVYDSARNMTEVIMATPTLNGGV